MRRRKPAKRSSRPGSASVDAELGVELVDRPVGLDPRMRLRHAAHVAEVRLAVVAEARVDPREIDCHGACATVTSRPFRVGGSGKPVQIRRGPATVTGDAHRIRPLSRSAGREGARGSSPGARRPSSDRRHSRPSRKGVGSMKKISPGALAALARDGAARGAGAGRARRTSTVRVEGEAQTLAAAHRRDDRRDAGRQAGTADVRRAPARCGALDRATGGDWAGPYGAASGLQPQDDQGRDAHDPSPTIRRTGRSGSTTRYQHGASCGQPSCRRATTCCFVRRLLRRPALRGRSRCASAACRRRSRRASRDGQGRRVTTQRRPETTTTTVAPAAGATVSVRRPDRHDGRRRHRAAHVLGGSAAIEACQGRPGPHGRRLDVRHDGHRRHAAARSCRRAPCSATEQPRRRDRSDGVVLPPGERQGVQAQARAAQARGQRHARPVRPAVGPAEHPAQGWTAAAGRSTARPSASSAIAAAAGARSGSATAPTGPTCCPSGSARAATRSGWSPSTRPATTRRPQVGSGSDEADRRSSSRAPCWRRPPRPQARAKVERDGRRQERRARRARARRAEVAHRARRRQALLDRARDAALGARRHRRAVQPEGLRRVLAAGRATPARSTSARSVPTASAARDGWVYKVGRRAGQRGRRRSRRARSAPGACCGPASGCCGSGASRTRPTRASGRSRPPPRGRSRRARRCAVTVRGYDEAGEGVAGRGRDRAARRRRPRVTRRRRRRDDHRARRRARTGSRPSSPAWSSPSRCG